ncbi:MAG: hypothetical protein ACJ751_28260 [Niastella sp.]|jgi:hypothetical protein|uniref:hypothetical protein n=1 Tax=Niastella sp. TaxID=1869183 RepID=UPI00389A251F
MSKVGNVPEIISVKDHLDQLKAQGAVLAWEIPYENLLTRLTAAVFFLTPADQSHLDRIWKELESHKMLKYRLNDDKVLSQLAWRVEFNDGFEL